MSQLRERAPAKVNLFLHVLGRRADGYHELESLVAFADLADEVELDVAPSPDRAHACESLVVTGPFSSAVHDVMGRGERLSVEIACEIARAAARPRRYRVEMALAKNLPVAAGLGGGTADGAATLRALNAAFELGWSAEDAARAALEIGADGPACLLSRPLVMAGVGEETTLLETWPALDVVLVNPGRPLDTAAVFKGFAARGDAFSAPHPPPPATEDRDAALAYLSGARNDLTAAAESLAPEVADVRTALEACEGVRLVRMSGSGATVWAAFDDAPAARRAADAIARAQPDWWTAATRLAGARERRGKR